MSEEMKKFNVVFKSGTIVTAAFNTDHWERIHGTGTGWFHDKELGMTINLDEVAAIFPLQ